MKFLGLFTVFALALSSCKYEESYQRYSDLADTKNEIEKFTDDLNSDELSLIGDYFVTLKDLAYQVKYNKKVKKYLNKKFNDYFDAKDCDEIFLGKKEYLSILNKCEVNGFFLCAEESKYYVEILKEFKKLIEKEKMGQVSNDHLCKQKMKDLGV